MQSTHEKLDDPANPRPRDVSPDRLRCHTYLKASSLNRCRFNVGRHTTLACAQACQTAPHCAYRPSCCDRICGREQRRKGLVRVRPACICIYICIYQRQGAIVGPNCESCSARSRPSHRWAWPAKHLIVSRIIQSPDQNVVTEAPLYQWRLARC